MICDTDDAADAAFFGFFCSIITLDNDDDIKKQHCINNKIEILWTIDEEEECMLFFFFE